MLQSCVIQEKWNQYQLEQIIRPFEGEKVQSKIDSIITTDSLLLFPLNVKHEKDILNETLEAYTIATGKLFWLNWATGDLNEAGKQLVKEIDHIEAHGLSSAFYGKKEVLELVSQHKKIVEAVDIHDVLALRIKKDIVLTKVFFALSNDIYEGRISDKKWELRPKNKPYLPGLLESKDAESLRQHFTSLEPQLPGYFELLEHYNKLKEMKSLDDFVPLSEELSGKRNIDNATINSIAAKLAMFEDMPQDSVAGVSSWDDLLPSLHRYQKRNGLQESNLLNKKTITILNRPIAEILDQVKINLERMRWLPSPMGEKFVIVNVPDFTLDVYENGKSILDMIVVVGSPGKNQTPILMDTITHIIFSPVWHVPLSIAKQEILQYLHIDPGLLIVAGVTVYYKGIKIENPLEVEWSDELVNSNDYRFKVKPSRNNSLGDVKFMFPNHHNVYLHDTNTKETFKEHYRAQSAGCIRVHKPVEFATNLLAKNENWDESRVKGNMGIGKENRVNMTVEVPVYLYYITSWVDEDGTLQLRKDIYNHDKKQLAKWNS